MADSDLQYIPVFPQIASIKGLNLADAVTFGAVWFYSFKGEKTYKQSPKTTGDLLGLAPNTIRDSLKKLVACGLITDLTPEAMNAPHEYKPNWLPEFGNQPEVTKNWLPEFGYQKLVTRLPKSGNQKPKRLPNSGNNKKVFKKDNNSNEVGAKAPPVVDKPKTQLMAAFQTATGLKMPHKKNEVSYWWSNIGEIYAIADSNLERAEGLVRDAVMKLRADRLTIGGPESLIKTCRALAAERNGNGPKSTDIKLSAEQAELVRQLNAGATVGTGPP